VAIVMKTLEDCDLQTRKELVRRVVSSSVICKSARLRDLFLYLCNRVLDESVDDIHELELGHKVFGRPEHYDTAADNIVRVHASLLRKRLAEHFQTEGIDEPITIEIPRGNYAPTFKKRDPLLAVVELPERREPLVLQPDLTSLEPEDPPRQQPPANIPPPIEKSAWKLWVTSFLALGFAALSAFFLVRSPDQKPHGLRQSLTRGTAVRQFWSGIFQQDASAQVVLDDASLDFYQEATGRPIALAEYFDRSYLHPAEEAAAAARLDPKLVHSFLLKRQSNFADVNLVSRLSQTAGALGSSASIQFARDFSFRQLKSGNMILLGTRQSNPWIQPFDSYLALRWKFDPALDSYYPVDSAANPSEPDKFRSNAEGSKTREGYASVAFLPNLGGTGNVLIISGTGGAAVGAALEFLNDEPSMSQLRSRMNAKEKEDFPYFETLLRVEKGASLPRYVTIVMSRSAQPIAPHDSQTAFAEPHH
jgi:hypothetical protein